MKAVLVYHRGIASIFQVDRFSKGIEGRNARRLLQGCFVECEAFARGMMAAGVVMRIAHCDMTGDVANQPWESGIGDIFSTSKSKIRVA